MSDAVRIAPSLLSADFARLGEEVEQMISQGLTGPEHLVRIDQLHKQISRLKALATAPATSSGAL